MENFLLYNQGENMDKQELILEFLSLLKNPKEIEQFSNPDWQSRVSIANLKLLIESKKKVISSQEELIQLFINKTRNSVENKSNIFMSINAFLNKEWDKKTKEQFIEIYEQRDFGKGNYHKWNVLEHTQEMLKLYRSIDFIPENVQKILQTEIDGISKNSLLKLAIVFHDVGKKSIFEQTGKMKGHEIYTINNQIDVIANRFNLTDDQKEFVTQLILNHHKDIENDESIESDLKNKNIFYETILLMMVDLLSTQGEKYDSDFGKKRIAYVKNKMNEI